MFWVARQELPRPSPLAPSDEESTTTLARNALVLVQAAEAAGLVLHLHAKNAVPTKDGAVHITRVGLPDDQNGTVVEWLRTVIPPDSGLPDLATDVELAAWLSEQGSQAADFGVAVVDTNAFTSAMADESELIDRDQLGQSPTDEVASPVPEVDTLPDPVPPPPVPPSRRRGSPIMWFGGVGALGGLAFAVLLFVGNRDRAPVGCDAESLDCAIVTPTLQAIPTATHSPTSSPTSTAAPSPSPSPSPSPTSTPSPTMTARPSHPVAQTATPAAQVGLVLQDWPVHQASVAEVTLSAVTIYSGYAGPYLTMTVFQLNGCVDSEGGEVVGALTTVAKPTLPRAEVPIGPATVSLMLPSSAMWRSGGGVIQAPVTCSTAQLVFLNPQETQEYVFDVALDGVSWTP